MLPFSKRPRQPAPTAKSSKRLRGPAPTAQTSKLLDREPDLTVQTLPYTTLSTVLSYCDTIGVCNWRSACQSNRNHKAARAVAPISSLNEAMLCEPGYVRSVVFSCKHLPAFDFVASTFTRLEEMCFGSVEGDAGVVAAIARCTSLKRIDFHTFMGMQDPDFPLLRSLVNLDTLMLDEMSFKGLTDIATLTNLRKLCLRDCGQVCDPDFSHLAALTELKDLYIWEAPALSDEALHFAAHLFHLESLELVMCTGLTGDGLSYLAHLPALATLRLEGLEQLDGNSLAWLRGFKALHTLMISQCPVTDDCLAHIGALAQLTMLEISACEDVTDAGLPHLAGLVQLTHLDLSELVTLTDAGFAHLVGLQGLKILSVDWTAIGDQGAGHLLALLNLENLSARFCTELTEDSIIRFAALPNLTLLSVVPTILPDSLKRAFADTVEIC